MMVRLEAVACDSEYVVNGAEDREKALELRQWLESTHLTFSLPGVLVGDLRPIVLVGTGSMGNGREDLASIRNRVSECDTL